LQRHPCIIPLLGQMPSSPCFFNLRHSARSRGSTSRRRNPAARSLTTTRRPNGIVTGRSGLAAHTTRRRPRAGATVGEAATAHTDIETRPRKRTAAQPRPPWSTLRFARAGRGLGQTGKGGHQRWRLDQQRTRCVGRRRRVHAARAQRGATRGPGEALRWWWAWHGTTERSQGAPRGSA
jgi:hypothetical protein